MARDGAEILADDEERDILDFILNACGLDSMDFYQNERILTRENLEKNYEALLKMVEARSFRRAPYFVIGYLTLITGAKMNKELRNKILEVTKWEHEEDLWSNDFIIERKTCLKDFREKIRIFRTNQKLRPVKLKYFNNLNLSETIIGVKDFKNALKSGKIDKFRHIKLDGWSLKTIPVEIFELENLESLSLEFNRINNVPEGILNLKSLRYLNLGYNKILKYIPNSVTKLYSLELLDLSHNYISVIPESIIDMKQLKLLGLDYNYISELPKTIINLHSLKSIYLRENKIKEIPEFLKNIMSIILK